jgi:hypothetical protein
VNDVVSDVAAPQTEALAYSMAVAVVSVAIAIVINIAGQ